MVARRNEKLAKRNPDRIEKQIDDLKAITDGGGNLTKHEEQVLEGLERDLKEVKKARDALGDKAPTFSQSGGPRRDGRGDGAIGKRRRDADNAESTDEDVPEDVKNIPMPRDTPPPIPKEILDEWYAKRRARRRNPNLEPLGEKAGEREEKKPAPAVEVKTVYEAKPVIRDLRKEAASAFVPAVVRMKIDKAKGLTGLVEPEDADRLEEEGYIKPSGGSGQPLHSNVDSSHSVLPRKVAVEEVEDEDG